jgi:hypothetical protein
METKEVTGRPCDIHEHRISEMEKDINKMGKKYNTVIFGEKGDNGLVGAVAATEIKFERIQGKLNVNRVFMSGIIVGLLAAITLLMRLAFFGPFK